MTLHWEIRVKFRAFGITFGSLHEMGDIPLQMPTLPISFDRVVWDGRGVWLRLALS